MKKFLVCLLFLSIGFSCKRDNMLCGCSPVDYYFNLSVISADHTDLLAPNASGAYTRDQIEITYKDGSKIKSLDFAITPPFSYGPGADMKYGFYKIYSSRIMQLRLSGKTEFYIRFGDTEPLPLSFDINKNNYDAENVKIDNKPLTKAEIPVDYAAIWILIK